MITEALTGCMDAFWTLETKVLVLGAQAFLFLDV